MNNILYATGITIVLLSLISHLTLFTYYLAITVDCCVNLDVVPVILLDIKIKENLIYND